MSESTSVAELKAQAKQMRKRLANLGEKVSHSECLERLAHEGGYKDWNTCVAALGGTSREGVTECDWVGIEGTIVPDFDYIGASISQIRTHVGANSLDLLVDSRNDRWWIDFVYYFDDHAIPQGTGDYQIRLFKQALNTNGWIELRRGRSHLIALIYNSSDDPDVVGGKARMTASDTIANERSRSLRVEDRVWALRREPDIEVRVFADAEQTLERFRDSELARQIATAVREDRTSRDENVEDEKSSIVARIALGSVWKCYRTYGDPFEFWAEDDEITIASVRQVDMVIGFLHHASRRSGEMALSELVSSFMQIENT